MPEEPRHPFPTKIYIENPTQATGPGVRHKNSECHLLGTVIVIQLRANPNSTIINLQQQAQTHAEKDTSKSLT